MCRFAPEISADKEENRRNPDGFQDFLTQSSGNLWREAVCGDLISGSLKRGSLLTHGIAQNIQSAVTGRLLKESRCKTTVLRGI